MPNKDEFIWVNIKFKPCKYPINGAFASIVHLFSRILQTGVKKDD
jgi:hypothetical protein